MSSNELVSIIIPIYNSEKYLKECLDSLFEQTYENIEIIAVNDGSTDRSLEILQDYSEKIQIFSQKNNGLYSALKVGISEIQGKWCKWFSPDDVLYPNAIEIQVNEAKKQNIDQIKSKFIPTQKNKPIEDFLPNCNFKKDTDYWIYIIKSKLPFPEFLELEV